MNNPVGSEFKRRQMIQASLGLGLLGAHSIQAQDQFSFSHPLRLIVPYPPGGAGDIVARMLSLRLSETLGQSIFIDNKAGGAQLIATEAAVKAPADGYTLFLASTTHSINPSLIKQLPYDSLKDFSPITLVASSPMVWLVHPSLGVSNIQELVAKAKAKPGVINYGSSGTGSGGHLAVEMLKYMAGIDMTHLPYKGAGPALVDLLSGQIQVICTSPLPAMPHVRSGRLKAIAVTSLKRTAIAPDIPTVAESGYSDYQATLWYALMTQSRVNSQIQTKLYDASAKALKVSEAQDQFQAQGADVLAFSPQQTEGFIKSEIERWSKVISYGHIKADI